MSQIAIIYWPKGGSVERCAQKINHQIGADSHLMCIENITPDELKNYDLIIAGGSTVGADHWSNNENQCEWSFFFSEMKHQNTNLNQKTVAIFGLGNQLLYPDHFVDSIAMMHEEFTKYNAKIKGLWPVGDYDFRHSDAEVNGNFLGLALDEDVQPELSDQRISKWLKAIM